MNLLPTIRNTAAGVGVCGLFSVFVLLIANAIAVFMAAKNFSKPEIKSVVLKGFDDDKAHVYVDLEFPAMPTSKLISAKTEGKVEVTIFMSPRGQPLPADPSITITLPEDINLNLLPNKVSRFIIDNLEIKFSKNFDSSIISNIMAAKIANQPIDDILPNLYVVAKAKVVFKSLWIPINFSLDVPHSIDLKAMLADKDTPKPIDDPEKVRLELMKEEIKANFDYKPRSIQVLASDNEKLEIGVVAAIPAVLIPEFMYVETPRLNFDFGLYEHPVTGKTLQVLKMINLNIDSFAMIPAPTTGDMKEEILIPISMSIKKEGVQGVKRLLELFRDKEKGKIGIQIKQGEEYAKDLKEGSLMYWFKDFILNIPVGEMIIKAEEKKKAEEEETARRQKLNPQENSKLAEATESKIPSLSSSANENLEQKQVASFKFMAVERLENGGMLVFRIRVLRSFASNFIGKLPEFNFLASLDEETDLMGIRITSEEVKEFDEHLDIVIKMSISNLSKLIHVGIRLGKLGSKQLHEIRPEIMKISKIALKSTSDNIISKLASVFDADILLNENGLEKVIFRANGVQAYPSLDAEPKEEKKSDKPSSVTEKKKVELSTKFAINNAFTDDRKKLLEIGTSIDVIEKPYGGDFARISWGSFSLKVKNKDDVFFTFKIHEGVIKVGLTGGAKPIKASFATGITIPSEDNNLKQLGKFLKDFTKSSDSFFILEFEIEYDRKEEGKTTDLVTLKAEVPCKNLLTAPPIETTQNKEVDSKVPVGDDKHSPVNEAKEKTEPPKKDAKKRCKDEPEKAFETPERTDFIGKVKNSVLSFVLFQASTLFFHAAYPNGYYCPKADIDNFDLKLHVEIALPMIEANVCASDNAELNHLSCFLGGGISRPMAFFIEVVDSQVCHVESIVLPQEQGAQLTGLDSVKKATEINYKNNEIPIHLAIKNFSAFFEFVTKLNAKKLQFVTIGPVEKASSVNNLIGHLASSLYSIQLPDEDEPKEKPQTAPGIPADSKDVKGVKNLQPQPQSESQSQDLKSESKPLSSCEQLESVLVPFDNRNPAVFEVKMTSPTNKELDIVVGFRLPENAFKGIPVINTNENNNEFNWPALQWGRFKYSVGIKDVFKASISVEKGQVDIKKDGIVPLILQNFAIRFNIKLDDETELGSTGMRQIWATFKKFFASAQKDRENLYNSLFFDKKDKVLFYNFVMKIPRGSYDQNELSAVGEITLKDLLSFGHVVMSNMKSDEETSDEKQSKIKPADTEKSEDPAPNSSFDDIKITMKTLSPEGERKHLYFPCLIPAICGDNSVSIDGRSTDTVELAFELKNILKPMAQMVGSKLGPVLQKFKMSNYPSHLQFKYTSVSETWITMLLNGAGLMSIGLNAFEIDRTALMTYNEPFRFIEIVPDAKETEIDEFEIGLKVDFPETIQGLRSTLNIFRDETVMLPLLAPVYYVGNNEKKELSNAPFHIAFSSDDRKKPGRNNLVSAFLASLVPEKVSSGINVDDSVMNMLRENAQNARDLYDKMGSHILKGAYGAVGALFAPKKEAPEVLERSGLPLLELVYMIACVRGYSFYCSTQIDFNFNNQMPFPNEIFKFILPATTIFRIFYDKKAVVQYIADARKDKRLEITSQTGLNILGSGNVCLNGIDIGTNDPKVFETDNSEALKFQVIFGKDVDLNVKFNFAKITSMFFPIFDILDVFRLTYKSEKEKGKDALQKLIEKAPAGRRRCLYDQAPQSKQLPEKIDFSKSAIFYEKDNIGISPGKEVNLYLQLRNEGSRVVCGRPEELKVKFIRTEEEQGFVKLMNFFSYKRPTTDLSDLSPVVPVFNEKFNLFEMKGLKFLHSGRYKIQLIYKANGYSLKTQYIDDTIIYVQNEY